MRLLDFVAVFKVIVRFTFRSQAAWIISFSFRFRFRFAVQGRVLLTLRFACLRNIIPRAKVRMIHRGNDQMGAVEGVPADNEG